MAVIRPTMPPRTDGSRGLLIEARRRRRPQPPRRICSTEVLLEAIGGVVLLLALWLAFRDGGLGLDSATAEAILDRLTDAFLRFFAPVSAL